MTKKEICVILDQAHGQNVKGKRSPDGALLEWKWSREICGAIKAKMQADGYRVVFSSDGNDEPGLNNRVQAEINYSKYFGKQKCVFLSIHCNAAGSDGKWKTARGFETHVARKSSAKSKQFASILMKHAEAAGLKLRRPLPKQDYWENDFYVLKYTSCPAVLVESGFMDNHEDCEYLLSKEGHETFIKLYCDSLKEYVDSLLAENQ